MVALMKNKMKKSTISAISRWRGEGMLYSRPGEKEHKDKVQVQPYTDKSVAASHGKLCTESLKHDCGDMSSVSDKSVSCNV